jgi:serine protease AprX
MPSFKNLFADITHLLTAFPIETGATKVWVGTPDSPGQTGSGINVAVIDSGVDAMHPDLAGQVVAINVNQNTQSTGDGYGHGTHVAAIVNAHDPTRQYLGIAPNSFVVSVKVADDSGQALESDLLRGLDWVDQNRGPYKIRVLNLSVSTSVPESYATSPIDAAVERLWHDKVVVVVAAGNLGSAQDAVWYAPANDPMVITVGCLDDNGTLNTNDDSLCSISSHGVTEDGFAKPDLVAPGRKIVSALATAPNGQGTVLAADFPDRITADGNHIRLSGTSMAAPQVAGAVALMLQQYGNLTPDEIKSELIHSAKDYGDPKLRPGDHARLLNVQEAVKAAYHDATSTNPPPPQVPQPASGPKPPTVTGTMTLLFDGSRWANTYFDGSRWTGTNLDGSRWGSAEWDGSRWTSAYWDGSRWTSTYFDGSRWSGAAWDSDDSLD